jgi:hypothetical protein
MIGRAETAEEKAEVLQRLLKLWQENPDLRLGQLIGNFYGDLDLYNAEDFSLLDGLESFYEGTS